MGRIMLVLIRTGIIDLGKFILAYLLTPHF